MVHRNNDGPWDMLPRGERITLPDPIESNGGMVLDRRSEMLSLFSGREREIVERICAIDHVDPSFLRRRRAGNSGGRLTFAEYHCEPIHTSYVFFDQSCQHLIPADKNHAVVEPRGRTVLLRVKKMGIPAVIQTWNDDQE